MILFLIAKILFYLSILPGSGFACAHIKNIQQLNWYLRGIAECIDITGNFIFQWLWNWLFLNSMAVQKFGRIGFSMSEELAKNYYELRTGLNKRGLWMCEFLIKRGDTAFKTQ